MTINEIDTGNKSAYEQPAGAGKQRIGIIRYGAGNIFSLTAALDRLNISYGMIDQQADFGLYDRYIIPGVGHAGAAMHKLQYSGMVPEILALKKPTLGICVGMQLLTAHSEEGNAELLNIVPLNTKRFNDNEHYKVPHTGWNQVEVVNENPLFQNIPSGSYFYFVHSYYIEHNAAYTIASTAYSLNFSAAVCAGNFYGVQFHPEKSGKCGETLLTNFSKL